MSHIVEASRAPSPSSSARRLAFVLSVWALAAFALAASGAPVHLPRPVIPLLLLGPLVAFLATRRGRDLLDGVPTAAAIAWHVPRALIGASFVVAGASGSLPATFALPSGYGDVVAGVGALAALVALRHRRLRLVQAWNVIAFVDIVLVVANAQRFIVLGDDAAARPFFRFPFPLLPLFYVPVVILTHIMLARRLRQR